MRSIVLLHLENAGARIEGEDHEVERLGEARTLARQLVRGWHDFRFALVEYDVGLVGAGRLLVFIQLKKRVGLGSGGEASQPSSVLELFIYSFVEFHEAKIDEVVVVVIFVQVAGHHSALLAVLDQLVLLALDHRVLHADDFVVCSFQLSREGSLHEWAHLNFASVANREFSMWNISTEAAIDSFEARVCERLLALLLWSLLDN